jgi:hypothetical protein
MSGTAKMAMRTAILHAEQFAEILQPLVRRDIALGRITLWARMQDSGPSEKLAATVVEIGDAIVSHYSSLGV